MNHLRHAPETSTHRADGDGPVMPTVPVTFQYARVKQSDDSSCAVQAPVPFDLANGVTAQFRAYYPTADASSASVDFQIAPDNVPLAPMVPNDPDTDPYLFKESYLGTITVSVGTHKRVFRIAEERGDDIPVDLTKGLDVKCTFDFVPQPMPIGPLLDIDITQGGP